MLIQQTSLDSWRPCAAWQRGPPVPSRACTAACASRTRDTARYVDRGQIDTRAEEVRKLNRAVHGLARPRVTDYGAPDEPDLAVLDPQEVLKPFNLQPKDAAEVREKPTLKAERAD
jgi:hypothetical protein